MKFHLQFIFEIQKKDVVVLRKNLNDFFINQTKNPMRPNESGNSKIRLKAYSMKEVAGLYDVSGKTLKTWLLPFKNEIGRRSGRFYTPKQMKVIFEKLGIPEEVPFS